MFRPILRTNNPTRPIFVWACPVFSGYFPVKFPCLFHRGRWDFRPLGKSISTIFVTTSYTSVEYIQKIIEQLFGHLKIYLLTYINCRTVSYNQYPLPKLISLSFEDNIKAYLAANDIVFIMKGKNLSCFETQISYQDSAAFYFHFHGAVFL